MRPSNEHCHCCLATGCMMDKKCIRAPRESFCMFSNSTQNILKRNSVDCRFRFVLVLCALARCLNNGELTVSQHRELTVTARVLRLSENKFEECIEQGMVGCWAQPERIKQIVRTLSEEGHRDVERALLSECLRILSSDGFERKRLHILWLSGLLCALCGLERQETARSVIIYNVRNSTHKEI